MHGEGEQTGGQVPSPRVGSYAQHTRDYRGEVNRGILFTGPLSGLPGFAHSRLVSTGGARWIALFRSEGFLSLLVILVAFAVRFHHLGTQSLWNDEGNSLRLAQRSIGDLIDAAGRDIHPPGYYLALKGWMALAGQSEFSLRALSALAGVLTVAVTIALGRALFSRAAGIMAGLLVALSPFAVYYSQEARMYALLGLFSAASMWVFVGWIKEASPLNPLSIQWRGDLPVTSLPFSTAWRGGRGVRLLALALINAAGLYTQYSFPFTMIAQGVVFALWLVRQSSAAARRALTGYALANLITLALFLPWLPTAWDQVTHWPRTGIDLALAEQLRTVSGWITYGNTAGEVAWLRFIFPALLIAAALWPDRDTRRAGWHVGVPLIWAGVVIGALFVSGAYREANLKFLLPAQVAVALLIGRGARRLWITAPSDENQVGALLAAPWAGQAPPLQAGRSGFKITITRRMIAGVCLFLVVIGQLQALDALDTDPAYARADYRAIAARITSDARPGDAIILDAPNQAEVFTVYYHGDAPIYELPRGLGGDDDQTRADVDAVLRDHRRIFVLFWGETERDPNRVVQATLDAGAYPVASWWYGDVRLAQYAVLGAAPTAPDVVTNARFGDHITLTGYALSTDAFRPGDVIGVTLFWTTDAPLDTRYKVTVQLLAPDGTLITQHDAEPGGNRALTTTWTPGVIVIDTHGLILPPTLPPGGDTLIVSLYDLNAPLDRLPVTNNGDPVGDTFVLPGKLPQ
jgi:mannosyltransferase